MYSSAYVWAKVLSHMEERLGSVTVSAWFDDAEVVELNEEQLVIYSPSDFRRDFIRRRCADYIEDGRKNFTCSQVRDYFYAYDFKNADADGRNDRLNNALLSAFRFTRDYVIKKNEKLSDRTNVAIMSLEKETEAYKNKSNLN